MSELMIDVDVLVIGGGTAGPMAAVKAKEANPKLKVMLLEKANVKISMDGKGQCLDNAKTERFFRTLKYDRIYVEEYNTPRELRGMLKSYISKYNHYRPHSSNGGRTPAEAYFGNTLEKVIA